MPAVSVKSLLNADFKGAARRIHDSDITRIARIIDADDKVIRALIKVEAGSSGFDRQKRPKMLFEPHVFYRQLSPGANRNRAVKEKLAYEKWKPGNYPSDSYPRLKRAMKIDSVAALKSASWGRGQILGSNYAVCGYGSVGDMVQTFMNDESMHVQAIVDFCIWNKIADDLKNRRWEKVARVYNGPDYAKHRYHIRLSNAYDAAESFEKQRKTRHMPPDLKTGEENLSPGDLPYGADNIRYPDLKRGNHGFMVEFLQKSLRERGFSPGSIDGFFGQHTEAAVTSFQRRYEDTLIVTGRVGHETWKLLIPDTAIPIRRPRDAATVADLRKKGSRTVRTADVAQAGGGVVAAMGAVGTAVEAMTGGVNVALEQGEQAVGLLDRVTGFIGPFAAFMENHWMFALLAVGALVIWQSGALKRFRVEDHRTGRHMGR